MEEYITGTGQTVLVHSKNDCKGAYCVIHNPSIHAMNDFPTHWRQDRHLMERICPHGIGHPDPDDLAFKELSMRESCKYTEIEITKKLHNEAVHGCDGCCCRYD